MSTSFFFLGALLLFFAAAKGYRLGKRHPDFVWSAILPFMGGVAFLIVSTLNLLHILTETWSSLIFKMIPGFLFPAAMVLEGRRQTSTRRRMALTGGAVIVALAMARLWYSSIIHALQN